MPNNERLIIVTTNEIKSFVKHAAKSNGMTMSQYVNFVLDRAALNGMYRLSEEDVSISKKYRGLAAPSLEPDERRKEMTELRFQKFWTLQQIADKYNLSRERVRQLIGNTGYGFQSAQTELKIVGNEEKTNPELAESLDLSVATIHQYRKGTRYKIAGDENGSLKVGIRWENWAAKKLGERGFDVELMPYGHKFDILLNGNLRIDVKVCLTKRDAPSLRIKSPSWRFHVASGEKRDDCDFYYCITKNEDVFVIPSSMIPENQSQLVFCFPTLRPSLGKYQKYHEAYYLLEASPAD